MYICDGAEEYTEPRTKEDNTCSYVKCDSRSETFDAFIRGTNSSSIYPGDECSGVVTVKPGQYKYIKNSVYGRYKRASLAVGLCLHAHDGSKHRFGGWWSPMRR